MNRKLWLGIDPGGTSGAWAAIDAEEKVVAAELFTGTSYSLQSLKENEYIICTCLERVRGMPRQAHAATWNFAENYGWWKGVLECLGLRYITISPDKWQRAVLDTKPAKLVAVEPETTKEYNKRLRENKKNLKNAITQFALRYFPDSEKYLSLKTNQGIADALCMALYAKRVTTDEYKA